MANTRIDSTVRGQGMLGGMSPANADQDKRYMVSKGWKGRQVVLHFLTKLFRRVKPPLRMPGALKGEGHRIGLAPPLPVDKSHTKPPNPLMPSTPSNLWGCIPCLLRSRPPYSVCPKGDQTPVRCSSSSKERKTQEGPIDKAEAYHNC